MNEYRMFEINENNCISTNLSEIIEKQMCSKFKSHAETCQNYQIFRFDEKSKLIFIFFKKSTKIDICDSYFLDSVKFQYKCHVEKKLQTMRIIIVAF